VLICVDAWNTTPFTRVHSDNTGSAESLHIAKEWLNVCVSGHASCRSEARRGRWYPTRLLDLGELAQDGLTSLRLITTKSHSLEEHYTTLSHRWGQAKFLQLTRHNLQEFHRSIPIAELPQTFREAILVSKALQVRYLWLDSLCIIQDDPSDWASEASQMHMVYTNSYCNISASHAENSTKGLFRDRNSRAVCSTEVHISPRRNYYTTENARQAHVLTNRSIIWDSIEHCPLNKRGWVLQERFLAPRVLHFCRDQIFLECRTRMVCELYDAGMPNEYYSGNRRAPLKANDAFWKKDKASCYEMWRKLIQTYSMMSLTYPSDKLAAISGVAKMVQLVVRDEYVAGMWRKDLVYQLLWYTNGRAIRASAYRAPSWSWASIDGDIDCQWSPDDPAAAEIVDFHIENATQDDTGQILGGWLDLKGSLRSVQLEYSLIVEGPAVNFQDYDGERDKIVAYLDDASLEDTIIVQQNAAAEYFCMYVATNWYLILRLADRTNKLYERIGLARDHRESGEETFRVVVTKTASTQSVSSDG
jgi:hypothetical protein